MSSRSKELHARIVAEVGANWLTVREIMINVSRGWPEAHHSWIEPAKVQYLLRKMEVEGLLESGKRPIVGGVANIYRKKAAHADPA